MKGESGSTFPLIIGFTAILLALTIGLGETLSLRLGQDRVLADASFSAAYLARDSQDVPFIKGLNYSGAVARLVPEATAIEASSADGKTIRVRICESWASPFNLHPPAVVCDEALARTNSFDSGLA